MNSNLVEGYKNEKTLGGKSDIVAEDVATIRTLGSTLGLHLNAKKCELIQRCPTTTKPAFRDFVITSKENATLLGAALTNGPALNDALESRYADLDKAIGRLSLMTVHDALTLLKSSFSASNIMHTLRCSPCHGHEALDKFRRSFENRAGKQPQTSQFRRYSGFRLAFRSASAGWEFDVWHRWHYPPFWHRPRPYTLSSLSSCTIVITPPQTYIGTTS